MAWTVSPASGPMPSLPARRPLGHRLAVLQYRAAAPQRLAAEVVDQVHDVAAQHPQVLAAAARVFLAASPEFQHFADRPVLDQLPDHRQPGAVTRLVRDGQLDVVLLAGGDHLVGLGQRSAKRLFHVDVDAALGGRHDHVAMLIQPARTDAAMSGFISSSSWR